jgi:hypothetical protein
MDKLFIFKKSGSVVEFVEDGPFFAGQPLATVKRYDTGKRMYVPEAALVPLKQIRVCSYCEHPVSEGQSCCKEVHNQQIWVTDDGDQTEIAVPRRKS